MRLSGKTILVTVFQTHCGLLLGEFSEWNELGQVYYLGNVSFLNMMGGNV